MGDLVGAEDALRQAHSLGRIPQPALALMRLSDGKVAAAYGAIRSALAERPRDRWARARMLPAQVEIAIAAGDPTTARASAEELGEISDAYDSPALRGEQARRAGGGCSWPKATLTARRPGAAQRHWHWQDVGAPYEVARDRALLATALVAARTRRRSTTSSSKRRGRSSVAWEPSATRRRRTTSIRAAAERQAAPTIAHKTFMFTDIVASTNLAEAMGDEAWEHLLRWHDDTIAGAVRRPRRRGRQLHRRRVLRGVRLGLLRDRVRCGDPAGARRAAPDARIRSLPCASASHSGGGHRRGSDYSGKEVPRRREDRRARPRREILASAATAALAGSPHDDRTAHGEPRRACPAMSRSSRSRGIKPSPGRHGPRMTAQVHQAQGLSMILTAPSALRWNMLVRLQAPRPAAADEWRIPPRRADPHRSGTA